MVETNKGTAAMALERVMPIRLVARRYGIGRRALVLILIGAMWVFMGIGQLVNPQQTDDAWLPHELLPPWLRCLAWAGTGVCAMIAGFWPPGRDHWGFAALVTMPMVRVVSHTIAYVFWMLPNAEAEGYGHGWLGALVWGAVVELIVVISSWPNPPTVSEAQTARRDD